MSIDKEALVAFATEPYSGSVRTQLLVMKEVARTSPDIFREAAQTLGSEATLADKSTPTLLDTYKAVIKKNETAKFVLEANVALVKGTLAAATILAARTGVGAVALGGTNWIVNKSLDQAIRAFEESARREARSILLDQLKKATDGTDISLESFKGKSPREVFDQLEAQHPVFDPELDNVVKEDRDLVHSYMLREIEKTVVTGNLQLKDLIERNANEIKEARVQVANIGKTLVAFAKRTGEELRDIHETLDSIQKDIGELKESAQTSKQDIRFIQNYLFGQMSVSEQRAAIRAGMRSDLGPEDQESLDRQLAVVEKQQKVAVQVQTYLNGAGTIISIAAKIGVNPEIVKTAQEGLAVGQVAFAAGTALMSGNFLQAAGALSGLLGMSGKDAETQRHEQILGQLKQISQQIEALDGKMDEMLNLQRETLRGLQSIYQAIVTLSQQISQAHEDQMRQIDRVQLEVEFVRALVIEGNGVALWDTFSDSRNPPFFDNSIGEFRTYAQMSSHFTASGSFDYFGPASAALFKLFGFSVAIPGPFAYQAIESSSDLDPNKNVEQYRKKHYEPLIRFVLENLAEVWSPDVQAFLSLFLLPARRVHTLLDGITIQDVADHARFEASMQTYFSRLLAPTTIRTCVSYLLDMFYYVPLIKSTAPPTLFSLDELLTPEIRNRETNSISLQKALVIVDIAIAQQALLSGHLLLPLFEKCYDAPVPAGDSAEAKAAETRRQERINDVESIVATSDLIRRNWLLYKVCSELRKTKSELVTFHLASQISQDAEMLKVLCPFSGFDWTWQPATNTRPAGWEIIIAGVLEPIPTWRELESNVLSYSQDMDLLIDVRSHLVAELANFDFLAANLVTPEIAKTFSAALFHTS